jgi:hypothetical protein
VRGQLVAPPFVRAHHALSVIGTPVGQTQSQKNVSAFAVTVYVAYGLH